VSIVVAGERILGHLDSVCSGRAYGSIAHT
jgi:hypothetical protein